VVDIPNVPNEIGVAVEVGIVAVRDDNDVTVVVIAGGIVAELIEITGLTVVVGEIETLTFGSVLELVNTTSAVEETVVENSMVLVVMITRVELTIVVGEIGIFTVGSVLALVSTTSALEETVIESSIVLVVMIIGVELTDSNDVISKVVKLIDLRLEVLSTSLLTEDIVEGITVTLVKEITGVVKKNAPVVVINSCVDVTLILVMSTSVVNKALSVIVSIRNIAEGVTVAGEFIVDISTVKSVGKVTSMLVALLDTMMDVRLKPSMSVKVTISVVLLCAVDDKEKSKSVVNVDDATKLVGVLVIPLE